MKLLVVNHPDDVTVFPDLQGKFHAFKSVHGVTSVSDENGRSVTNFFRASDNVAWETHLPSASKATDGPVRHQLTVTLPKPVGAQKAWLVTNIGTSAWGSNVIRKAAEYRGNAAQAWLTSITPGSQSYADLFKFIEDEEMYRLKVWVSEGEAWKQEAVIHGQGPLISEDRVYPIDVSGALGDSLVLRFNPPKGFWTFDYLGVSYEDPAEMGATRVDAHRALDQKEASILASLESIDQSYYVMPEVGDWGEVCFPVPVQREGMVRSVYLETTGYYELHLRKDLPNRMAQLFYVWTHPGEIVKTSLEEYRVWQAERQASLSDSR
jgi:hypothetical protein